MGLLTSILLIVLGVIAAAGLLAKISPGVTGLIDKLEPAKAILGLIGMVLGAIWLINQITGPTSLVGLAVSVCLLVLGLLMGVSFVRPMIKNPIKRAKFEAMFLMLRIYQGGGGVVAMVLGVWGLIG